MSDAGIYSLIDVTAGLASAFLTGPAGQIALPEKSLDALFEQPQGYDVALVLDDGTPFGSVRGSDPVPVDLDKLPESFLMAVLAAEDARFFQHRGIDAIGLAGAVRDTLTGQTRGGSTITQQMVKNTLVGPHQTFRRKITEGILAIRLHEVLGVDRVLKTYLETAWFGRRQNGVMGAAQAWFGKSWSDVTLSESAYLAALLKGPARYDARHHPERAKDRRDWILGRMHGLGWISEAAYAEALAEPLGVTEPVASGTDPGLRWILSQASAQIRRDAIAGQLHGGDETWTAWLTIDPQWQAISDRALHEAVADFPVREPFDQVSLDSVMRDADFLMGEGVSALRARLAPLLPHQDHLRPAIALGGGAYAIVSSTGAFPVMEADETGISIAPKRGDVLAIDISGQERPRVTDKPAIEGAVILLDPRTGAILASIGGHDPHLSAFDRTHSPRQPGSAAKTFLWLAALEAGLQSSTFVPDIETEYVTHGGTIWRPQNYDRSSSGMIPLFRAFERSSNLVAAHLADRIGIEAMARMAESAGAWQPGDMGRNLAASLGASETTLVSLTAGYAAIINDGLPRRTHVISRIGSGENRLFDMAHGSALASQTEGPVAGRQSIDDILAMMRGVTLRGTASRALSDLPVPLAGKTGTSQDHRDAWFVGVTPHLAIGIWLGRDDNRAIPGRRTGGDLAAPIAARIMREAHARGLISATGLRDHRLTSGITWPPVLHQDTMTPAMSIAPEDHRRERQAGTGSGSIPDTQTLRRSSFWGTNDTVR